MKTKLPEVPAKFARQHPEIWAAFERLAKQCHEAGPLDAKTARLVKLGIALGAGLEGGVHAQVRNALARRDCPRRTTPCGPVGPHHGGFPGFNGGAHLGERLAGWKAAEAQEKEVIPTGQR